MSLYLFPLAALILAVVYITLGCWGPRPVRDALARFTLFDFGVILVGAFVIFWLIA